MSKNIYVGNIPFTATEDDIHNLFLNEGKINKTQLITDRYTGKSKGFGFVEMENDEEATGAIEKLNNFDLNGRKLIVNEARPREARPAGFAGSGGGRDNSSRW